MTLTGGKIYGYISIVLCIMLAQSQVVSAKKLPQWLSTMQADYIIVSAEDASLEKAKEKGCVVCAMVNNEDTQMAKLADIAIETLTGAEAIKGSTRMKAGTSQKLILNMFSTSLFIKMGCTYQNYMVNMIPNNIKLRARAVSMVSDILEIPAEQAQALLEEMDWDIKSVIKSQI